MSEARMLDVQLETMTRTEPEIEAMSVLRPKAPVGCKKVWRTFRQQLVGEGTDPHARRSIEQEEREKWLRILVDYVTEARLSYFLGVEGRTDSYSALRHAAGERKAATIRQRLKTWANVRVVSLEAAGALYHVILES